MRARTHRGWGRRRKKLAIFVGMVLAKTSVKVIHPINFIQNNTSDNSFSFKIPSKDVTEMPRLNHLQSWQALLQLGSMYQGLLVHSPRSAHSWHLSCLLPQFSQNPQALGQLGYIHLELLSHSPMVQNRKKKHNIDSHLVMDCPTSEGVSEVSKRVSAAKGASEASSPEQANEWAVRANERTDKRVAQYYSLYSWLLSTIVKWHSYIFPMVFCSNSFQKYHFSRMQFVCDGRTDTRC